MPRKVEAESRKLARGTMWRRNPVLEKNLPWSLGRGPAAAPPRRAERYRVSLRQTSRLLRQQSENELLKGKVRLLEEQVAHRDAQLVAVRREWQRADPC